jgi:hypothetical protein
VPLGDLEPTKPGVGQIGWAGCIQWPADP